MENNSASPNSENMEQLTPDTTDPWVLRHMPAAWRPYARLMRLERPIGIWLLLFPAWWGLALVGDPWPNFRLAILFAIGAIIMRGAGCVYNDLVDQDLDQKVTRTQNRPLAAGILTRREAQIFLGGLLALGALILFSLGKTAIILGIISLGLIAAYPHMKRITYWPQLFLGITFNMGALISVAAVTGDITNQSLMLYIGCIFWTLGYDTIYALQDREDDLAIGIKSTAILWEDNVKSWVAAFYLLTWILWLYVGLAAELHFIYDVILMAIGGHMAWQILTLKEDESANCLARFRQNRIIGWMLLGAILLGKLV